MLNNYTVSCLKHKAKQRGFVYGKYATSLFFCLISPHCIKFRLKFQKLLLKGGRKVWLEKAEEKNLENSQRRLQQ